MDKNQLSRLEHRIQSLVEGGFARLFNDRLKPRDVALQLARAMDDNAHVDASLQLVAPNHYTVRLHPVDHAALLDAQPDITNKLAQHLIDLARESDLKLETSPQVDLDADDLVAPRSVEVSARRVATRQATQALDAVDTGSIDDDPDTPRANRLPPAFLVLDGGRYIALNRTVINVGRRRTNDIVVDDPRVSRQHCQLRFRHNRFVVYDLGSRAGTTVNGEPISECALRPGDVIGLAGVLLVYVVDEQTDDHPPSSPVSDVNGDTELLTPDDGESRER